MIQKVRDELIIDEDGKQRARKEFEGTKAERLAFTAAHADILKDCDEWWETDTHKLKSWNASTGKWAPEDE